MCSAQALFLEVAALYVVDILELAVLSVLSSAATPYDLRNPRPSSRCELSCRTFGSRETDASTLPSGLEGVSDSQMRSLEGRGL